MPLIDLLLDFIQILYFDVTLLFLVLSFLINHLVFPFQPDGANVKTVCGDAVSYCGAKDQKYPDTKPMGFPFDRPMIARSATELLTDNMSLTEVVIKFMG